MEYGFYLPSGGPAAQPDALASIARQGDKLGFFCMVMPDHVVQPKHVESQYPYSITGDIQQAHQTASDERLEQVTTLAYLAGITERIKLVTSVMIIPYRNPILTAKMLATLDMLSKGRLILGAGVGWMEEEFELVETEPFAERGEVTNEYLRAFIELWTKDEPEFDGKYVSFSGITFLPKPVQKPYPPIDRRPEQASHQARCQTGRLLAPGGSDPRRASGARRVGGELGALAGYCGASGKGTVEDSSLGKSAFVRRRRFQRPQATLLWLPRRSNARCPNILRCWSYPSDIRLPHRGTKTD